MQATFLINWACYYPVTTPSVSELKKHKVDSNLQAFNAAYFADGQVFERKEVKEPAPKETTTIPYGQVHWPPLPKKYWNTEPSASLAYLNPPQIYAVRLILVIDSRGDLSVLTPSKPCSCCDLFQMGECAVSHQCWLSGGSAWRARAPNPEFFCSLLLGPWSRGPAWPV